MNPKLERFLFGLILAPLAPIAGFLSAWWASFSLLPERWIPVGAIAGFLLGVLADIFMLKKLIDRAYQLQAVFWAVVFLFYTVGIFGFFMGVPVFNALLALPAGFVAAAKMAQQKAVDPGRVRQAARRTAWFTTGVLFFVCAASAFIALLSSSTTSDLRGMLRLGFEVTQGMIIGLIFIGGLTLLAVNWVLTLVSLHLSYKFLQHTA
jgi:hypothetical protein